MLQKRRRVTRITLFMFLVEVLTYMKMHPWIARQAALPALPVAYAEAPWAQGASGASHVADSRYHYANRGARLTNWAT